METYTLKDTIQRLSTGELLYTEFVVDRLFIEGNISQEDYVRHLNDKSFKPTIRESKDTFPECLHLRANREGITWNKDKLITMDLNFFE